MIFVHIESKICQDPSGWCFVNSLLAPGKLLVSMQIVMFCLQHCVTSTWDRAF